MIFFYFQGCIDVCDVQTALFPWIVMKELFETERSHFLFADWVLSFMKD